MLIETPTNPLLDIVDLEQIQKFSEKKGVPYFFDNTFATMELQDGLKFGAKVVYYSASKYLGGHHNAIGGIAVTRDRQLADEIRQHRRYLGNAISPFAAHTIHMGLGTLPIRMREHSKNAQIVAEYLAQQPMVSQVYYPGLPSHPGHEIAKKQMKNFGGVVSFKINADPEVFADAVASQDTQVIRLSESLGSIVSLLANPAKMSNRHMTPEQRAAIGVDDNLFRFSVGIEDSGDIINSLEEAFDKTKATSSK